MRSLALALAAALLATGCSNACQDLGERLCSCTPAGTTKNSCVQGVKTEVDRLNPGKDVQAVCSKKLETCYARTDPATGQSIDFCDWIDGRCGKAACGLSEEEYDALSDPATSPPNPDHPGEALCPK
jgi:hypothetical protein